MSMLVASFMFIALLAVSLAHLVWSLGKSWPIRNETLLARTVVGTPNVERMPPRLVSFAVAVGTLAAGILALALADHESGGIWLTLLGIPFAVVFLTRGVVGYLPWWAEMTPEPIFRLNDRRVYSPLCLFIGLGFLVLIGLRLF